MSRKHAPQTPRRRKAYSPLGAANATRTKPRGAFRLFSNYRIFAIIGAAVLFGGYGISALSGGTINAHGNVGGGSGSHERSVRGEGVRRIDVEATPGAVTNEATIRQYAAPPPVSVDAGRRYRATIQTSRGDIVVELLPAEAPLAVSNFIFLAREGFYDGVAFHRVIPGFVAQAGDPTGTGLGGPGYDLPFESSDEPFAPGVLAMAKPSEAGAPNNGSQFFFPLGRERLLDGRSTVFGRVVDGMEVLESLTARDPDGDIDPPPGDVIESIEVVEE
jgi:cyclophilin family peptidyl-prolyl cis-trans isomerase